MEDLTGWGAFGPADLLLPRACILHKWSVVAGNQYAGKPEYWEQVKKAVGRAPSTLRLMLPDAYLGEPDAAKRVEETHRAMYTYLETGRFSKLKNSFIYLERKMKNGAVRRGLLGVIDLEQFEAGEHSASLVRPTQAIDPKRLEARLSAREGAPLELSHVLLFIDDPKNTVIGPVTRRKTALAPLYTVELMGDGGHLSSWWLPGDQAEDVREALAALSSPETFAKKYGLPDRPPMAFAVADGNHSLAAARACYDRLKRRIGPAAMHHPARYAMAELVDLYDKSVAFEPVHRVVTEADTSLLREDFSAAAAALGEDPGTSAARTVRFADEGGSDAFRLGGSNLPASVVQHFLDGWLKTNPGRSAFIRGADVAERLGRGKDAAAFILPPADKFALFSSVVRSGVLPSNAFSMGRACEHRFYLECRRIEPQKA